MDEHDLYLLATPPDLQIRLSEMSEGAIPVSMESAITQVLVAHHKHVNERWKDTPIGGTLCVHDTLVQSTEDGVRNDMKVTFVVESHIMIPGDAPCVVKYRKIEYGPKGPEDSQD